MTARNPGLGGMAEWRGPCFHVIELRHDGARFPLPVEWGDLAAAKRYAAIVWADNADPDIAGYAVSDGKRIVCTVPDGGGGHE